MLLDLVVTYKIFVVFRNAHFECDISGDIFSDYKLVTLVVGDSALCKFLQHK